MSWLFASGGQSIGASASVLPINIQGWFLLGLTGLTSCSPRDSEESSSTPHFTILQSSTFMIVQLLHPYMTQFSSVQLLSRVPPFITPWITAHQASLPSPTLGAFWNSCALSRWCHPDVSYSVSPFPSCSQSLPQSGTFPMSQLFASGGQSIGVSASASVLPMNTQDWSLGWTGWISLQCKSLLQYKSINFSTLSFFHSSTLTSIHDHWKNYSLD